MSEIQEISAQVAKLRTDAGNTAKVLYEKCDAIDKQIAAIQKQMEGTARGNYREAIYGMKMAQKKLSDAADNLLAAWNTAENWLARVGGGSSSSAPVSGGTAFSGPAQSDAAPASASGGTASPGSSAKQTARSASTAWKESLSEEERRSITDYTGEMPNYYRNINGTLRGLEPAFDPGNAERAAHIHDALQKASLPVSMTVYRKGGEAILGALAGKSDAEIIGAAFRDRAFISTAMSEEAALGGNTTLRILLPQGCHAANIENLSQLGSYEEEILIDRDQIFVITGVSYEGTSRIIDAVLLNKK